MEAFVRLGLKEVANIVKDLGISTNIMYLHGNVQVNGELYVYEKKGNQFSIGSADGRRTTITIDYKEEKEYDEHTKRTTIYLRHDVSIDYLLSNGEHLTFKKNVPLDRGYEAFENVNRHDLLTGVRTQYVNAQGEEVASFSTEVEKVCLKGNNKMFEFTDEGILTGNRIISSDGSKLVSISGFPAISLEEAKSFNVNREKGKLESFVNFNPDLHRLTKEVMDEACRKLERKDREVKETIRFYNEDMVEARDALRIRNSILANMDSTITPDALDAAEYNLRAQIIAVLRKQKEELAQQKGESRKFSM